MTAEDFQAAILDASVAIKLFVVEEGSKQADLLFNRLADDPPASFYVPDLFYAECANTLWKYVRNYGYPAESARQDLKDLLALTLQSVSTSDLIVPALELALAYDLAVYDAYYPALAQAAGLPLVTADTAMAEKLLDSPLEVRILSEI